MADVLAGRLLCTGIGSVPTLAPTLGDLVTNAKKVTVSVLYWYEKLSSLLTEIFKMILKRIKNLFLLLRTLWLGSSSVSPGLPFPKTPFGLPRLWPQSALKYTIGYVHT